MLRRPALALVFSLAAAFQPLAAHSTEIKSVSSAGDPIGISRCDLGDGSAVVTLANRTRHDLLSLVVHFVDQNRNGQPIGGLEVAYAPSPSLLGAKSGIYQLTVSEIPLYGGTAADIAHQSCSVESAVFSGNHQWAPGQAWAEPLVAAAAPTPAPQTAPAAPDQAPASDGPFTVMSSWTTSTQTALFLHVRVNLHPTFTTTTQSSDFRLVTISPTGGHETVYGLNEPAPTYLKTAGVSNFLATLNKQATPAPIAVAAVVRSEDLGAQGRVQIIAGDPITEVVTFSIRADVDVDPAHIAAGFSWLPQVSHSP